MSASLMGKVLSWMGFEETLVDEGDEQHEQQPGWSLGAVSNRQPRAKVVGLPTAPGAGGKVMVTQPVQFDEAKEITDHLKNRRMVIVNLEDTDPDTAQRIVDFVSGATVALNGTVERVGKEIFFFAPSNVDVTAGYGAHTVDEELFSWPK